MIQNYYNIRLKLVDKLSVLFRVSMIWINFKFKLMTPKNSKKEIE
jgi:hypothetical protein